MSINFSKGRAIANLYQKPEGKKKKNKVLKTVHIYDDNFKDDNPEKVFEISKNNDDFIFPIPQKKSERLYISAPSGAGKSTFIGLYLDEIRKKDKKRHIFVFSRVTEDEPIDRHKPVRIPLDREIFDENPLVPEDFEDSVLIFDDIDTLMDKPLLKYIQHFRDDLLECGRHYGITTISTTHQILNFHETRKLLNEANGIVIFPKATGNFQLKGFLERYMGMEKKEIEEVRKLPSRWVYFNKEYPMYMIYNKGVVILS